MNLKKANDILGYIFFTVGALKIIIIILALLNVVKALNGGSVNYNELNIYSVFTGFIGLAQFVLAIVSIVMIVLNIKVKGNRKIVKGYLFTVGAILVELLLPSILAIIKSFISAGIYMSAGTLIRKGGYAGDTSYRKIKKQVESTDWFYKDN